MLRPQLRSKYTVLHPNIRPDASPALQSSSSYPSPISMSPSSSGRSSSTSRGSTPDAASLEETVRRCLGLIDIAVDSIELLPRHLHRIYRLNLSDGQNLVMKCTPPHRTRLLRSEQYSLEVESLILDLLSNHTSISLPELIKQDPSRHAIGTPFALMSHASGTPLSNISSTLSPSCRRKVDLNIGNYMKVLASLTSPFFGCPQKVSQRQGFHTWKSAFALMTESLLRDAEDALINVPFNDIRHQVKQHGSVLDDVIDARLVRFDAGNEKNIFLDEHTMDIVGVVGWSNVVWGDPMMTDILCDHPNEAVLEGYGGDFDAGERGQVRQLLYTVFHALTTVVTQNFRPTSDVSELTGRRKLTLALNQLASLHGTYGGDAGRLEYV